MVKIEKAIQIIEDSFIYLSCGFIAGLVVVIAICIITRLINIPIVDFVSMSGYMLVAIVFLSFASVTRRKLNLRVKVLKFSPRVRKVLSIISEFIETCTVIVLMVVCWQLVVRSALSGAVTATTPIIKYWILQLPLIFGLSLFSIRMVIELIQAFRSPTSEENS